MKNNRFSGYFACLFMWVCCLCACSDTADLRSAVNDLKDRISSVEDAVDELKKANAVGKLITSVTPIDDYGYRITFSDGSVIELKNAEYDADNDVKDGVTPVIKIDAEGYWCVSYDNGATFVYIEDAEGNKMKASGTDGLDGNNGRDGICVRVVVDEEGYYVFELYSPENPQTVLETVKTPYTSDTSSILQSVVEDTNTGVVELTLADGSVFRFNLDISYPTGIVILADAVFLKPRSEAAFEFRVNPSNAVVNFIVDGENANLQLDLVGLRTRTASGYATLPTNYRLTKVEQSKSDADEIKAGQYTVTIEDSGVSDSYSENVALVLTTKDGKDETIQLSSPIFEIASMPQPYITSLSINGIEAVKTDDTTFHIKLPFDTDFSSLSPEFTTNGAEVTLKVEQNGSTDISAVDFSAPVTFIAAANGMTKEYKVIVHFSNLPVVYITTPIPITSKSDWTKDCNIEIWNAGAENGIYAEAQIKGRGNSTWGLPKKPYAIKLDKKAAVLGMPKHKRWVLLANFLDHTCMRNAAAFEIARCLPGLEWTPRGRFVDVVMNGVMIGNYYLCEQIKVDENRVDIAEITPDDIYGDTVTGGYIFELDVNYDEAYKFKTSYRELPVQFKDPDEDIANEQMAYVQNYFNRVEDILFGDNALSEDVFDYIDIDSFIDWWFVHELANNYEPSHPKSCYMNKDRNGKLKAGPVWDFDYATFKYRSTRFLISACIWYPSLLKNPTFVARAKERWALYKNDLMLVDSFIEMTAAEIRESAEANIILWPNSDYDNVNCDTTLPFMEAVESMRNAYVQRIQYIDAAIAAL